MFMLNKRKARDLNCKYHCIRIADANSSRCEHRWGCFVKDLKRWAGAATVLGSVGEVCIAEDPNRCADDAIGFGSAVDVR